MLTIFSDTSIVVSFVGFHPSTTPILGTNASMDQTTTGSYVHDSDVEWEDLGDGIRRKLLTYENQVMMAKIEFQAGAIGVAHSHPHIQCSYVESGEFELTINGVVKILRTGDSFLVPSNQLHGAVAITEGILIDVFTPMREDFLA